MKKTRKRVAKIALILISVFAASVLVVVLAVVAYATHNVDFAADEALFASSKSGNITRFYYDKAGGTDVKYEPVEYDYVSGATEHREWYSYSLVPENLKSAFLATEDRQFYAHHGVNIKRTVAAVLGYVTGIGDGFGASTITQQVIKNISGDNQHTARRKLNEIVRALHLEYYHSKEEIFEVYLNVVPMGEGVVGVGLASERYFDKELSELSLAECATLVGITNAPTRYNPYVNYDACLHKRNVILNSMLTCGYISENEYSAAVNEPIRLTARTNNISHVYSWFTETVCDELIADLMSRYSYSYTAARVLLFNGGLSVYTTLDPQIQAVLESYIGNNHLLPGAEDSFEVSMVVTNNNADLCGIVGARGTKIANRVLNHALVPHPPASVLKPLALYAPLINSRKITWSTIVDDSPVEIYEHEDGSITEYPHNSPDVYSGRITLRDALASSKNTVAVRLYEMLGKEAIYKNLTECYGFDTIVRSAVTGGGKITDLAVSPLALGQLSYGVTLRKLTEAYTVFPSEGKLSDARSYVSCFDSQGKELISKEQSEKRIFSVECAQVMNGMLSSVVTVGTASRITLDSIVDTAGKTGTSAASRDKLFVGYTPYYTAGIWCGYNDNNHSVHGSVHLEFWDMIMKDIHEKKLHNIDLIKSFSFDRVERVAYCKDTGLRFSPYCAIEAAGTLEYGYFIRGTAPREICRHDACLPVCRCNLMADTFTFFADCDKIRKKGR